MPDTRKPFNCGCGDPAICECAATDTPAARREDRTSHAADGLTQRADNHRQSTCASCDRLQNALNEALWIVQMRVHPDDIASLVEQYQQLIRPSPA